MANARLGWFSPLGVAASIRASARRVGLRVHRFRFSARTASEIPLGGLVLPPSASEWPLGEFVLPPSVSELPLSGLAFGVTASAFRHAPLRSGCWASWFFRLPLRKLPSAGWPSGFRFRFSACAVSEIAARRVGLRAHCFRFSACAASEIALAGLAFGLPLRRLPPGGLVFGLTASAFRHAALRRLPSAGWPSGSLLPLFGTHRFGGALGGLVLPLGGLAFGFTASAFRHAPLRKLPSAGWPSGSPLPLFGMHRFAPPHCRSEDRRSTPTRHLFHFKTLIPTC